jgi:hypothetical protein
MKVGKPGSLFRHAEERVGTLGAGKVCAFMVAWQVVRDQLGREPTVREYAEWWRMTERGAYGELRKFRQAFGEEHRTPSAILDQVLDDWERSSGARGLGYLPVPAVIA